MEVSFCVTKQNPIQGALYAKLGGNGGKSVLLGEPEKKGLEEGRGRPVLYSLSKRCFLRIWQSWCLIEILPSNECELYRWWTLNTWPG